MFGLLKKRVSQEHKEEKRQKANELGRRFGNEELERAVQALKFVYDAEVEATDLRMIEFDFTGNPQLENNINLHRMVFQLGYFAAGGQMLMYHGYKQVTGEDFDDAALLAKAAGHKALSEFPIANEAVKSIADGDAGLLFKVTEAASRTEDHGPAFQTGGAFGQGSSEEPRHRAVIW